MNTIKYGTDVSFLYMIHEGKNTYHGGRTGQSHPFDDVFNTLKTRHTKLFIPVINAVFGTDYGQDEDIALLPTEGNFMVPTHDNTVKIIERVSDFLLKIRSKCYLIECQSSNDSQMVIRLAEYTFLAGMQNAVMDNDIYDITMPSYTVLYVRSTRSTPRETKMRFTFPNRQSIEYNAPNILLTDYTKEEIVKQRMYLLIPFYILRYEKDLKTGTADMEQVEDDLRYFREALQAELETGGIRVFEEENIRVLTNTIINYVFEDKVNEEMERMVKIMGGNVIETEVSIIWDAGITEGGNQFVRALKLLHSGECSSVQDLMKENINNDIAVMATQYMLNEKE